MRRRGPGLLDQRRLAAYTAVNVPSVRTRRPPASVATVPVNVPAMRRVTGSNSVTTTLPDSDVYVTPSATNTTSAPLVPSSAYVPGPVNAPLSHESSSAGSILAP